MEPNSLPLDDYLEPSTTTNLDDGGTNVGSTGSLRGVPLATDRLSSNLPQRVLSQPDRRDPLHLHRRRARDILHSSSRSALSIPD